MRRYDPMIKVHKRPHFYFNKVYSTAPNTLLLLLLLLLYDALALWGYAPRRAVLRFENENNKSAYIDKDVKQQK